MRRRIRMRRMVKTATKEIEFAENTHKATILR